MTETCRGDDLLKSQKLLQQLSLSQWDNEGGAGRCGPKESTAGLAPSSIPVLTNTTAFARSRQSSI